MEDEIEDAVAYAMGLWPRGEWTFANQRLWRKQLKDRDQKLVRQALENVKMDKSSERVQLAWVLRELRNMAANLRHSTFNSDSEVRDDEIDHGEIEWNRTQIMEELENQPREVTDRLLAMVKGKFAGLSSSGPVREWSWLARGMVWAAGQQCGLWSGPPLDPSLARELLSETERSAYTVPTSPPSSDQPSDTRPIAASAVLVSEVPSADLYDF